jgi:NADPH-dependent 2,4-dienoyl-CoA reductase/sulfur reductase-like enzyme
MTHAPHALDSCDLLIVGAGPAGMAAALAAAPSGAAIVLLDDNPAPGGQIWRDGPGAHLPTQARALRAALERHANIRVLTGTRVVGLSGTPEDKALILEDAERGWTQRADKLVLCTGARELLLPFPGWTLPGVTGAGGLQALVKAGLPVRGQRIVIAGTGPLLLAAARTAADAGAHVVRIAEQASSRALVAFALQLPRWPAKAAQAVSLFDRHLRAGSHVVEAIGEGRLQSVRLHRGAGRADEVLACDRLACGFGLVPNTQLGELLGCALDAREGLSVDALQATRVPGIYAAGECTGFGGSERALVQGAIAGHAAVGDLRAARALRPQLARWQGFADALHRHFALTEVIKSLPRPDTLLCRCEDVPYGDVARRTGWIDAKLHTRCGMGACQGRVCGAAARVLLGWTPAPPRHLLAPARIATLVASAAGLQSAGPK